MGKRKAQQKLAHQPTSETNIIMEQRNELLELLVRKDEAIQNMNLRMETEIDSAISESADFQARIDELTALVTKLRQSQTDGKLQRLVEANSRLAVYSLYGTKSKIVLPVTEQNVRADQKMAKSESLATNKSNEHGNNIETLKGATGVKCASRNVCGQSVEVTENDLRLESKDNSSFKSENANLSKIKELVRDNTEMRKALSKLEAERNLLTAQAGMLEQNINDHKQKIETLQEQKEAYAAKIAAQNIVCVHLKADNKKKFSELAEKRRKIQQLELRNEQLSSLTIKHSNSNTNLENVVASLKKKLTEEKASNEILRKKLDVMQASAGRLNTEPLSQIDNATGNQPQVQVQNVQRKVDHHQFAEPLMHRNKLPNATFQNLERDAIEIDVSNDVTMEDSSAPGTPLTPSAVIISRFVREQSASRTRDGSVDSPGIRMVVPCDVCESSDFHGFGEEPVSCVHAKPVKGNENEAAEPSQSSSLGGTVPRFSARQKDRRKRNAGGSKKNGSKR